MKKMLLFYLCLVLLTSCSINQLFHDTPPIAKTVATASQTMLIGIDIRNLETGDIIYQQNPEMIFTPASTLKLFTTYLALKQAGEDYRFPTEFLVSGEIRDSILYGNLYIKASGDPTLGSFYMKQGSQSPFNQWQTKLRKKGIKTITGNLYLIRTGQKASPYRPGWLFDDYGLAFQNEITEFSYQNNLVLFNIVSDSSGIRIRQDSLLIERPVSNQLKQGDINQIRLRQTINEAPVISGSIQINSQSQLRHSISESENYFMESFKRYLQQQSLLNENAVFEIISPHPNYPDSLTLLFRLTSPPLDSICQVINKYSINPFAEQVNTYLIKADFRQENLKAMGIDTKVSIFDDGSGLSIYNKIKPSDFSKLMAEIYYSDLFPSYLQTLSVGGEDGTLKNRLTSGLLKGKIYGKSGSMRNINNVVAFYQSPQGNWYSVVILANNIPAGSNINSLLESVSVELP